MNGVIPDDIRAMTDYPRDVTRERWREIWRKRRSTNKLLVHGWSIGNPLLRRIKKWRAHTDWLVKHGFLEQYDRGYFRLTDLGHAAKYLLQ